MSNVRVSEPTILLKDPLSREARSERRSLLGASAIGIVIVKTGLVPSKISALGIEFNQADQRSLLLAIAAVIFYFLIAFLIYAGADFLLWRIEFGNAVNAAIYNTRRRSVEPGLRGKGEDEGDEGEVIEEYVTEKKFRHMEVLLYRMPTPVSGLRAAFEFALPIVIGVYAVITLVRARL